MLGQRGAPKWLDRAKQMAMKQWQREFNYERSAIYLTNPESDKPIERIIKSEVWPVALEAIMDTRFRILGANEPRVEKEWHINACCSVSIVLEDPARPIRAGASLPWYARLSVECGVTGIGMLHDYLGATLPLNTPLELVFDLLSETSHGGIPTTMSVSNRHDEMNSLYFVFEHGGSGSSRSLSPTERIRKKLPAYCDFAEAVYEIEEDPSQPLHLRKLIREVNSVFEI